MWTMTYPKSKAMGNRIKFCFRYVVVLGFIVVLTGCAGGGNFSEREGFSQWFERNPPSTSPASEQDVALLERYRPRLWVGPRSEGPISFYKDYISAGTLVDGAGKAISSAVTSDLLNRYREDSRAVFTHKKNSNAKIHPEALGRIQTAQVETLGELKFLSWHFVFRTSGLPHGLGGMKKFAMGLVGDLDDWHQLDHYTAVVLVLDNEEKPIAMLLQQHNYRRSFIFGCDVAWPKDDRVRVVAARGSNELYPYAPETTTWRSVPFMDEAGLSWLFEGKEQPTMSGDDVADPAREIEYEVNYVAGNDAFYSFQGFLGKKRLLPGRSGPPGADYDTLPAMKDLGVKLTAFNWIEGDLELMPRLGKLMSSAWSEGKLDENEAQWLRQRFNRRLSQCGQSG